VGNGAHVYGLGHDLNKVSCKTLVIAESFKSSDNFGMLRELAPEIDDGEPGGVLSAIQSE